MQIIIEEWDQGEWNSLVRRMWNLARTETGEGCFYITVREREYIMIKELKTHVGSNTHASQFCRNV